MPPPIQVEIQDIEGNSVILTAKSISRKTLIGINQAVSDYKSEDMLNQQMVVIFGGKPDDYDNIDLRVIKNVLQRVTEEITGKANPT